MIKDFSIFCEGVNDNFLYHSAKYEYAIEAIRNNKMLAKTFHFFYRSDTRKLSMQDRINHARKLYGISTTRSREINFGSIKFVFDKNKLSTKYKVVPFDFAGNAEVARNGNSIRHRKYFEREEFIIVSNSRGKYLEPLDKYIHGFYVDEDLLNEVNQSDIEWMENHPLFLGYYSQVNANLIQVWILLIR